MKKNIKTDEKNTKAAAEMPKGINVNEIIAKTAKETARETMETLKSNKYLKDTLSYFKKTEILLYNYPKLKLAVDQKQEDIDYIEKNGLPGKSKSIVMYSSSGGGSSSERYLELIEKYKAEKVETERDIKRIEAALKKVSKEKYYEIIKLKYFDGLKDEEIALKIEKDMTTVYRNRKRLINDIKVILFPESIKEFM